MIAWPDRRLQELINVEIPLIQAPMAGADSVDLAVAVSEAGGLGSLGCALMTCEQVEQRLLELKARTAKSFNLNFFCHVDEPVDSEKDRAWRKNLSSYYDELGLSINDPPVEVVRPVFDEQFCRLLERYKPPVVSFHFGLPDLKFVERLRQAGLVILSSATSVAEARWLAERGCHAIIAQGFEAGGHRGMFLTDEIHSQTGTFALVPQIVDAVDVPVIAAGGIADARGIAASFALGASGAQLGTAYLLCPEAPTAPLYRQAIMTTKDNETTLTNLFTGRPARGILNRFVREMGPMSKFAPPFPHASQAVIPLRKKSEAIGSKDFMQMWSGQAASLCLEMTARDLTLKLATESLQQFSKLARRH